jgi:hypothetical protein
MKSSILSSSDCNIKKRVWPTPNCNSRRIVLPLTYFFHLRIIFSIQWCACSYSNYPNLRICLYFWIGGACSVGLLLWCQLEWLRVYYVIIYIRCITSWFTLCLLCYRLVRCNKL